MNGSVFCNVACQDLSSFQLLELGTLFWKCWYIFEVSRSCLVSMSQCKVFFQNPYWDIFIVFLKSSRSSHDQGQITQCQDHINVRIKEILLISLAFRYLTCTSWTFDWNAFCCAHFCIFSQEISSSQRNSSTNDVQKPILWYQNCVYANETIHFSTIVLLQWNWVFCKILRNPTSGRNFLWIRSLHVPPVKKLIYWLLWTTQLSFTFIVIVSNSLLSEIQANSCAKSSDILVSK